VADCEPRDVARQISLQTTGLSSERTKTRDSSVITSVLHLACPFATIIVGKFTVDTFSVGTPTRRLTRAADRVDSEIIVSWRRPR
jgi:hypothetical protein